MKKIKIAKQKAYSPNNPETGQFEKYEKGLTRFETLYVRTCLKISKEVSLKYYKEK